MNSKINGKLADMNDGGMSYGDIAEEMGLSVQAVRGRIRRYRDAVKDRAEHSGVEVEQQSYMERKARESGIDPINVSSWWHKTSKDDDGLSVSLRVQQSAVDMGKWRDELIADMQQYSPVYPEIIRGKNSDTPHLLELRLSDIHTGDISHREESGDDYDANIAVQRTKAAVAEFIQQCSGYNLERIIVATGDDLLHSDGASFQTTKGTQLQTSELWYRSFKTARRMVVEIIESLLNVADIHYVHVVGNHDKASSFFLSDVVHAWFRNSKNITWDITPAPRKYYLWNDSMIINTHGHGRVKGDKLALLAAAEQPVMWGQSKHRYIIEGHQHHRKRSDHSGVSIEGVPSPSISNSWHIENGYFAPAAMESFLFHPTRGKVGNFIYTF